MTFLSGLYDNRQRVHHRPNSARWTADRGGRARPSVDPGGPAFDPVPQEGPARQAQGHAPRQRCHRLRARAAAGRQGRTPRPFRAVSRTAGTRPSSAPHSCSSCGPAIGPRGPCRPSISPSSHWGSAAFLLGTLYVVIAGGGSAQASILSVLVPGLRRVLCPEILGAAPRAIARGRKSSRAFPDALDLMLVCVEAGQPLDQGDHPRRTRDPHRLPGIVRGIRDRRLRDEGRQGQRPACCATWASGSASRT